MFLEKEKIAKLSPHKFYIRNKVLLRIIKINKRLNQVTIYRYDTYETDVIAYDTAHYGMLPIFRIGEVSKMVDRKTDTLRKYERRGLIPPPQKFSLTEDGTTVMRGYTESDVNDLVEFFATRGNTSKKYSAASQKNVVEGLQARFKKIQNVGGKSV